MEELNMSTNECKTRLTNEGTKYKYKTSAKLD